MFHEVAHGLGIKNTLNDKGLVRTALRDLASAMEEGKADVLGLYMIKSLYEKGEIKEGELMDYYVTFVAGIFRSVRFGASSAHGRANMVRFNYFQDRGAFKRDAGGTRPIRARTPPAEGVTVMGSHHYADDPRMGRFLEGRHVARVVNIGSAEKFCRLAEGTADLYPRFGRTMEWDTAAPQAVVEAAGGRVLVLEGRAPLRYAKLGFENPGFVCEGLPG